MEVLYHKKTDYDNRLCKLLLKQHIVKIRIFIKNAFGNTLPYYFLFVVTPIITPKFPSVCVQLCSGK